MKRFVPVLAASVAAGALSVPAPVRAHGCEPVGAIIAAGFFVPLLALTALEVARASCDDPGCCHHPACRHRHHVPPPPPGPPLRDPPPSPLVAASAVSVERGAEGAIDSGLLEVRPASGRRADPARAEAEALLAAGRFLPAAEAFRALAIDRGGEPAIALRFAEALLGAGNLLYAEHWLAKGLEEGAGADALRTRTPGAALAARMRLPGAGPLLARSPRRGELLLAWASHLAGDDRAAMAALDRLLRDRPDDAAALRLRALLAAEPGRPPDGGGPGAAGTRSAGGSAERGARKG